MGLVQRERAALAGVRLSAVEPAVHLKRNGLKSCEGDDENGEPSEQVKAAHLILVIPDGEILAEQTTAANQHPNADHVADDGQRNAQNKKDAASHERGLLMMCEEQGDKHQSEEGVHPAAWTINLQGHPGADGFAR